MQCNDSLIIFVVLSGLIDISEECLVGAHLCIIIAYFGLAL